MDKLSDNSSEDGEIVFDNKKLSANKSSSTK